MATDTQDFPALDGLRAKGLARPQAADLFKFTGSGDEERAAFDAAMAAAQPYLDGFTTGARCPCCTTPEEAARPVNAMADAFLGRGFDWGIQYGEMNCRRCGYPARGQHSIDLGEGGKLTFTAVMPYHPDALENTDSPSP